MSGPPAPSGAPAAAGAAAPAAAGARSFGSKLVGQSAVYGLGNIISKMVSVFLVPVYTRVLTTADYGIVSVSGVLFTFLWLFLNLGTSSALFRYYHESDDRAERADYVTSAFFLLVGTASVLLLVAWFAQRPMAALIFGDADNGPFVFMTALWCFTALFPIVPLAIFRAEGRPTSYVVVQVGSFLLNVVMTVIFIVVLRRGAMGVIESSAVAMGIVAVPITVWLVPRLTLRPRLTHIRRILDFGLPLVPFGLGMLMMNMGDRVFLTRLAGKSETGLYSLGYTAGMLVNLIAVQPFHTAWWPLVFSTHKEPGADERYGKVLTYFVFASLGMALGLGVLAREGVRIIATRPFWAAWEVTFWVALAYVLYGAFYCVTVGIILTGKSRGMTPLSLIGAAVAVAGYALLIPPFGRMGAAAATLIAFAVMCVAGYVVAQRKYPIRYEWGRVAKLVVAGAATFAALGPVAFEPVWAALAVKAVAVVVVYLGVLWVLRFFVPRDYQMVRDFLVKAARRARLTRREVADIETAEDSLEVPERP